MIESVNNEKIKYYSKLNTKKYRDSEGLFIVEGEHLVLEAEKLGIVKEIFSLNGEKGIKVTEAVMGKLSNLSSIPNILAICKKIEEKEINGNILLLDNIQDPGNLGTIIRSAVAFGIDTIVASNDTVDVYNTKTLRSSEGMIFHINYLKRDLVKFIEATKGMYTYYTTNVNEGADISNLNIDKPYAIVMGNEGAGVSSLVASKCDKSLYIPMSDKCESLNVAIATSIILYEFSKK